jgi:hypothetical protein
VHDINNLEARGVVSVFVASEQFREGAEAQASALGFPAARVFVPHPIQDRTDEELTAYADAAYEEIVARITCNEG